MPIPKPNEGESQDNFISRCMSNDTMGEEYPDNEQRLAICFQSWRDRNKRGVDNLKPEKKVFNFEVKQIGLEEDRKLAFTGSTEAEDRDGDIIEASGWDLKDYNKNPVIMGFHEYDKFPYAKSTKTYIDHNSKQLKFEIKFPTMEELTSFPGNPDMIAEHAKNVDMAYNMYKNGYMNAVSVGFIGKESEPRYNDDGNYKGRRYKKQSLLELSLVPVPSNPTALQEARSKGIISDKELSQLQIEKGVISYHKYPLADEGESWDGPREIAAASVEDLKKMCAWYDAENADNKGAYKLPHHKQSGYTTVWRAVAAAMAALLGARGGVQLPESDRRGVYNHLAKHYKDFDKEPPEFKTYTDTELKAIFPDEFEKNKKPPAEKAGAELSTKNRQKLARARDLLTEILGDGEQGNETAMRTFDIAETKSALEEIKSQVLLLSQKTDIETIAKELYKLQSQTKKDAPKEINLDAIEYTPPAKKNAKQDELQIEPEELKKLIADTIKEQIATIN